MEETLSPKESLDLIAQVIFKTKENIRENSFGFLLWGWIIAIASFGYFFLHHYTSFQYYFIPFPILAGVGIITTVLFFRKRMNESTLTYANHFISKMWIILGLCFVLVMFINVSQGKMPFTYTLIIAGIGTLVSGWVMKFRPMIIGGTIFLAASIVSIYIADDFKPLLHGMVFVAGYLIPGYLLKNSKK